MNNSIGQLISVEFTDRKDLVSGFIIDYSEDWILLRNNPVDFIIDGYVILKNKNIKSFIRGENEEFTEKVIHLKGLDLNSKHKIPLTDLSTILRFLTDKYGVFHLETKREKTAYLGKLVSINEEELVIDFLETKGIWGGEIFFKPRKIRVIEFDTDYINSLKLIANLEQ